MDGDDVLRLRRNILNLLPQFSYMVIHCAADWKVIESPNLIKQLLARDDFLPVKDEAL